MVFRPIVPSQAAPSTTVRPVEGLVESDDHGLGFLHVAAVMDLWSRRIVGSAMASHLRAELVIEAVEMAT
jgi:transposase InsO family protein